MSDPFWLIGPPRSGSTFWSQVIDQHPKIFLTSETRVATFMYRCCSIPETGELKDPDSWMRGAHHSRWSAHLKSYTKEIVESFYRNLGMKDGQRWGDKFPHYADPHPDEGVLQFMVDVWPGSQFIYLTRDTDAVVRSIVAKGWRTELTARVMIDEIDRHVNEFFGVDSSNLLRIKYEDNNQETLKRVFDFLGVGPSGEASEFLAQQEINPTPFSEPTSWKRVQR